MQNLNQAGLNLPEGRQVVVGASVVVGIGRFNNSIAVAAKKKDFHHKIVQKYSKSFDK